MSIVSRNKNHCKPVALYLPKNLDVAGMPRNLQTYALALVSRITWRRAFYRQDRCGYIRLKMEYLQKIISKRSLPKVITALVASQVIEVDRHYVIGKMARGYKLAPGYASASVIRIPCPDAKLQRKLTAIRDAEYRNVKTPAYNHLRQQFEQLSIDEQQAYALCETLNPIAKAGKLSAKEYAIMAVSTIQHQDWEFKVCAYNRVHHNLSRLPKLLRPCLRVNGERLIEIDICNSQPIFLALLMLKLKEEEKKKTSNNTHTTTTTGIASLVTQEHFPELYDTEAVKTLFPDEQEYLALCENGFLYDAIMARLNLSNRKAFKKQFYRQVLFGRNNTRGKIGREFRRMFPHVNAMIKQLKRGNYKNLAHEMQKDEARFMITLVCESIRLLYPDAPIFTIHDSILTTEPYVGAVQAIMMQEFENLGITPTLETRP